MRNILKLEITKAIKNKYFLVAVLIGCAITFLSALYMIEIFRKDIATMTRIMAQNPDIKFNPMFEGMNIFNCWVGGEAYTLGTSIFFFIFPALIAIPFGWSYCSERKTGYVRNVVIRSGKTNYFLSKYIALFISGGLAMTIPLVFNFLLIMAFIPIVRPDPSHLIYTGVYASALMSSLYYTKPFLYVFLYLLIDFVFAGLVASISFSVSGFTKNRVVAVLSPFLMMLTVHYGKDFFRNAIKYEISPLYFLRAQFLTAQAKFEIILIEAGIIFFITFFLTVVKGSRNEIY